MKTLSNDKAFLSIPEPEQRQSGARHDIYRITMKILITGGASGLGEAITRRLARDVANEVWFTYRSSAAKAHELEREFANARGIRCDFTSTDDMAALLKWKVRKMSEQPFDSSSQELIKIGRASCRERV